MSSTRCQGWTNPDSLYFGPHIDSLSSYQSPSGSNTLVSINGSNFYSFSSISFGTFYPTVYFINTNIIQFYVPNTLSSGTFSVQVFNGSVGSNIVTYTIDNASGYWLLNSNNSISNTNSNGVVASWLSRGAPVTLGNTYDSSSNPYIVPNNVNWIISDASISDASNNAYISLPTGTQYSGREIMVKSINGTILATSSNIQQLSGGLSNVIVSGNGRWVTLVSDGSMWYVMQGSSEYIFNNIGSVSTDITLTKTNMFKVNIIYSDASRNVYLPNVSSLNDGDYVLFNFTSSTGGAEILSIKNSSGITIAQTGGTILSGGNIRMVIYSSSYGWKQVV